MPITHGEIRKAAMIFVIFSKRFLYWKLHAPCRERTQLTLFRIWMYTVWVFRSPKHHVCGDERRNVQGYLVKLISSSVHTVHHQKYLTANEPEFLLALTSNLINICKSIEGLSASVHIQMRFPGPYHTLNKIKRNFAFKFNGNWIRTIEGRNN